MRTLNTHDKHCMNVHKLLNCKQTFYEHLIGIHECSPLNGYSQLNYNLPGTIKVFGKNLTVHDKKMCFKRSVWQRRNFLPSGEFRQIRLKSYINFDK